MATTLARPRNLATSTLALAHTSGGASFVVAAGEGSRFGSPTASEPIRVVVVKRSTLVNGQITPASVKAIFFCTSVAGDVLSGLTLKEGTTDHDFTAGDVVAELITAGTIEDLNTLALANEAAIAGIGGDPTYVRTTTVYADPAWLSISQAKVIGLPAALDAKAPLASPALTGTPTAPTATAGTNTTQIATTAFVAAGLATKANDSAVVHTTGSESIAGTKTFSSFELRRTTTAGATTLDLCNTEPSSSNLGQSMRIRMGAWSGFLNSPLSPYIEAVIDIAGGAGVAIGTYASDGQPARERIRFTYSGSIGFLTKTPLWQFGFVGSLGFQAASSTSTERAQGALVPSWADSTDATRKGRVECLVYDAGGTRSAWRAQSDGTQALLGFFGVAATARPTVTGSRGGNAALASLLSALASLGLITDSTTA